MASRTTPSRPPGAVKDMDTRKPQSPLTISAQLEVTALLDAAPRVRVWAWGLRGGGFACVSWVVAKNMAPGAAGAQAHSCLSSGGLEHMLTGNPQGCNPSPVRRLGQKPALPDACKLKASGYKGIEGCAAPARSCKCVALFCGQATGRCSAQHYDPLSPLGCCFCLQKPCVVLERVG